MPRTGLFIRQCRPPLLPSKLRCNRSGHNRQRHRQPAAPRSTANSDGAAVRAVSVVRRRRGSDFASFPYEKAAGPVLTRSERLRCLVAMICAGLAFALTYGVFVLRCVQNGRILDSEGDARADRVCLGGVVASACLMLICLLVQVLDSRRRRKLLRRGRTGGGCSCCCWRRKRSSDTGSDSGNGNEEA